MSPYVDRVAYALQGLEAVSTGVCPGCDECRRAERDYLVTEFDDEHEHYPDTRYTFKAADGTTYPTEELAEEAARTAFADACQNGQVNSEAGFSHSPCDICGSRLAGDREDWHAVLEGKIHHWHGACVDCVQYLANGTLPESENT